MKFSLIVTLKGGLRWQQPWHQPWAHPPGPFQNHFRTEFRSIGPWQNHPRLFAGPIRSDFHQFHAGFNPRLAHPALGPNGPIILPNGPLKPLSGNPLISLGGPLSSVPPSLILGTSGPMISKKLSPSSGNNISDTLVWAVPPFATSEVKSANEPEVSSSNSDELPPADPNLLEEILKDTMRSINIDNVPREIRYYGHTGIIFMHWDDPRDIGFQHGARRISIDGKDTVVCSFNDDYREFTYDGEVHRYLIHSLNKYFFHFLACFSIFFIITQ
jgi:pre-mRNA cleavage complex 2 protein Pcf11